MKRKIYRDDPCLPEGATNDPAALYNETDEDEEDLLDQACDDAYDTWVDKQLETNEKKK
jgi:hypothetical protein